MKSIPPPALRRPEAAPLGLHVLALVLSLSVVVFTNIAYSEKHDIALYIVCFVGLTLSALTWVLSGKNEATPEGTLAVAAGLFAYFPGLYYVGTGDYHPLLLKGISISVGVQVATTWLMLSKVAKARPTPTPSRQQLQRTRTVGVILLISGGLVVQQFGLSSLSLPANAAFVGASFIMYGAIFAGSRLRVRSFAVSAIAIGLYMALLFNTGGRLVIAALVFGAVFMASMRVRSRLLKVSVLGALVPALFLAARQRSEVIQDTRGVNETGLESVVWPIDRLAELLQLAAGGHLSPTGGDTLFATLVFWVPRDLWAGKPLGFGAQLVPVLRPNLVGIGHSEAATIVGEWVWDFGVIGLVLLPLAGVLVLRGLQKLRGRVARDSKFGSQALAPICLAIIGAGMLDLFWIGTFGFASRAGQRLIILSVIFFVYYLVPNRGSSSSVAHATDEPSVSNKT